MFVLPLAPQDCRYNKKLENRTGRITSMILQRKEKMRDVRMSESSTFYSGVNTRHGIMRTPPVGSIINAADA